MDDLIAQFALEARELVQQASDDLLALEADPGSLERLESVFRAIHTMKGSTALFDFGPMLGILHHAEDLLSQARGGKIAVDTNLLDQLLAVVQWVDDSIDGIAQSGRLPDAQEKQAARLIILMTRELADVQETPEEASAKQMMPTWAESLGQHSAVSRNCWSGHRHQIRAASGMLFQWRRSLSNDRRAASPFASGNLSQGPPAVSSRL